MSVAAFLCSTSSCVHIALRLHDGSIMVSEVPETILFLIHNQRVKKTIGWKSVETSMGTNEMHAIPLSNHISEMMESVSCSFKTMTH